MRQDLQFTVQCQSCGTSFPRRVEPRPAARDPVTLYCRYCGCPQQVDPVTGVVRDRWSPTVDQLSTGSAAAAGVPRS